MKTRLLLFVMMISAFLTTNAQTFIWESFDAGQMPPAGWSLNGLPAQWAVNNSSNAGGTAPECQFTYFNQTTTTRLISPMIDLTGKTSVKLSFRHAYDWYANPAPKVGVATRSHNGTWTSVWEKSPTGNIAAEPIEVIISNSDVGQTEFQFCFYLNGNLYNLDYWYLDNVLLFNPLNLDAGVISLNSTPTYFADPVTVKGTLMNVGITTVNTAELNYKVDNGPVVTNSFSGLSLATQAMYNFSFDTPMTGAIGSHELTVWISKINGVTDDDQSNDTIGKTAYRICYTVPRKPLYEEFTSSTCSPCAQFNTGFVPWCTTNEDSITLVKYQMSWPSPGDPYYTAEGGVRKDFYGVNAVPDLYTNGSTTATDMGAVAQSFTMAKELIGMMKINGTHTITGTSIALQATVLPFSDFPNVRFYIVVMEKVTHNNHMSNGETSFHHVMMKMIPDAEGTTVDLTDRVPFTVTDTVDLAGTHIEEYNDLIVGLFVQNPATKEVYQSAYSTENAQFSTEARLSTITWDGTPLVGFDPNTFSLTYPLPGGSTSPPVITGIPMEPEETVIVVPTLTLPGTTTIDVFAEDLIHHNQYLINFTWFTGQDENPKNSVSLWPNPTRDKIQIYGAEHSSVTLMNSAGLPVRRIDDFTGTTLDLNGLAGGVYHLQVDKDGRHVAQKKIVIL